MSISELKPRRWREELNLRGNWRCPRFLPDFSSLICSISVFYLLLLLCGLLFVKTNCCVLCQRSLCLIFVYQELRKDVEDSLYSKPVCFKVILSWLDSCLTSTSSVHRALQRVRKLPNNYSRKSFWGAWRWGIQLEIKDESKKLLIAASYLNLLQDDQPLWRQMKEKVDLLVAGVGLDPWAWHFQFLWLMIMRKQKQQVSSCSRRNLRRAPWACKIL